MNRFKSFARQCLWPAGILFLILGMSLQQPSITKANNLLIQVELPGSTTKLIFIHHSSGENWLADEHGGLGRLLQENNYFVSDTNYGWGPDNIGDRTDIVNWPEWFRSLDSPRYLSALFAESGVNSPYSRTLSDPGGENQVVMFKSCFPNSDLSGSPDDPARQEDGLTVANAKYIYNDLLKYFATRPDKLFIAITAPPLINPSQPENARAFNTWLVQDWLRENNYTQNNVAVFDFYNVLTHPDNHHRLRDGQIEYITTNGDNRLYYDSDGDDHPNPEGNQKAAQEFVPLLNLLYQRWKENAPQSAPPPQPEPTETAQSEAAGPTPVEGPAPQPAPVQGEVIDDFEGTGPAWEAFWQENTSTSLTCVPNTQMSKSGSASLMIDYNVLANTWATCELNLGDNQDWSGASGLSFAIRASAPAQVVDVMLFGDDPGARVPYIYKIETTQEMIDRWVDIVLTWDMLVQPEYEANPGKPVDPNKVNGLAFAFNTFPDAPSVGKVWVDDLMLSGYQGAEKIVEPSPIPSETPTKRESEPPKDDKGGGICSSPLLILGLVLAGLGWRIKKNLPK